MSLPSLTFANIRSQSCISEEAVDALQKILKDKDLAELSRQEGKTFLGPNSVFSNYNIRLGWYRDDANKIKGLFLCYCNQFVLTADRMSGSTYDRISLCETPNCHYGWSLDKEAINSIFKYCTAKSCEASIELLLDHIEEPSEAKDFCANNLDMLPKHVRKLLEEPEPKKPEEPEPNRNNLYIVGALVLALGFVIFFAKKYFAQPHPD